METVERSFMVPATLRDTVREIILNSPGEVTRRSENSCQYAFEISCGKQRLVVKQYTNGTLQVQGRAGEVWDRLEPRIEEVLHTRDGHEGKRPRTLLSLPHAGTDEAGKGDYFGPLVVAGVLFDDRSARDLAEWGILGSKRVTDDRCRRLSARLMEKLDNVATVEIAPETYNRLYRSFRAEGKNLNHLLAWGHGKVIEQLSGGGGYVDRLVVLVDKFAPEQVLLHWLNENKVEVVQKERAEADIAVASASLIARAKFLRALERLGERIDVDLPKGAGARSVRVGRNIFSRGGMAALAKVAKLHFKNTEKIKNRLGR